MAQAQRLLTRRMAAIAAIVVVAAGGCGKEEAAPPSSRPSSRSTVVARKKELGSQSKELGSSSVRVPARRPAAQRQPSRCEGPQSCQTVTVHAGGPSEPVYSAPEGTVTGSFGPVGPYTVMGPLWLPVEQERGDWWKIGLPGPPNGASAWIRSDEVQQRVSRWLVVISLSSRTEAVYRSGKEVAEASVATGAPDMPTPIGHTFIDGDVATIGPYAISAPVLRTLAWNSTSQLAAREIGGTIIALHGWEDLSKDPGVFGYATSHGCIRAPAGPLTTALQQVPTGSPVWIES